MVWDLHRTQGLFPASSQAPASPEREMVSFYEVAFGSNKSIVILFVGVSVFNLRREDSETQEINLGRK